MDPDAEPRGLQILQVDYPLAPAQSFNAGGRWPARVARLGVQVCQQSPRLWARLVVSASSAEVGDLEQRSELRVADPVPVMFRHQASPAVDVEIADKSPDEARHVFLVVCECVV